MGLGMRWLSVHDSLYIRGYMFCTIEMANGRVFRNMSPAFDLFEGGDDWSQIGHSGETVLAVTFQSGCKRHGCLVPCVRSAVWL
jgi:hypothetical protein